ncbi:MAG: hypothetical protein ABEJ89_05215 [Haloarculaceae archaeon]
MESFVNLFGPLDQVASGVTAEAIFVLVLLNFLTRFLAYRHHVKQYAEGGAEAITRYAPHVASNVLLVLSSFYFMTLHHHAGFVMSVLVLGLFLTDFFEFESRMVEARREMPLERPKGAMVLSLFVFMYAFYQSFFWILYGPWSAIF